MTRVSPRSAAAVMFLIAMYCPAGAWGASNGRVAVTAAPEWVVPVPYSGNAEPPPESADGATYLELLDLQHNAALPAPESYVHAALRVLNEQGVAEASQLSVDFNPAFQSLAIHRVVVRRGAEIIDRLEPSGVRVIQRESRLEYRIYDGRLTALLMHEDVRAGDVVEYSYTIKGVNSAFAGHCDRIIQIGFAYPIARYENRLVWESDRPLIIHKLGAGPIPDPRIEELGQLRRYVWVVSPALVTVPDDQLPENLDPFPCIQVTSIDSWADVADWGTRLFSASAQPLDPVRARAAGLPTHEGHSKERAALAAIRFVQDDVRYLGVELGTGSHRPTEPNRVIDRRFGDCKDKSLLLVTLLRSLGWRADPALVSASLGREIARLAPSRQVFDHVIVRIEHNGKTHWIDPTLQGQRGESLSRLSVPSYGRALILRPGVTGLTPVGPPRDTLSLLTVEKTYQATDYRAPARLTVRSTYHGSAAEDMRVQLRSTSRQRIAKVYLEFYRTAYPEIVAVDSLGVVDDEDLNQILVLERYSIPGFWKLMPKQSRFAADLGAIEIVQDIPLAPQTKRTMPLGVNLPRHVVVSARLDLAEEWASPPSREDIENDGFRFKATTFGEGRKLHVVHELERLRDVIAPESAPSYSEGLTRLPTALEFTALSSIQVASGGRSLNWPLGLLLVAVLAGSTLGATFMYRGRLGWAAADPSASLFPGDVPVAPGPDPTSPDELGPGEPPPHRSAPAESAPNEPGSVESTPESTPAEPLSGTAQGRPIGGWLILLGVSLAFAPFLVVKQGFESFRILESRFWDASIHVGESVNPSMAGLLIYEACFNILYFVGSVLLLILFANRKRQFPRVWMVLMTFSIVVQAVALSLSTFIGVFEGVWKEIGTVFRSALGAVLWGMYLIRSQRVRETFVR